jgi:hypothetical protein
MRLPSAGVISQRVDALTAVSPTDVWALGSYEHVVPGAFAPPSRWGRPRKIPLGVSSALALHWDGTRWSRVPVPDPTVRHVNGSLEGGGEFRVVAAIAPTDIWAIGNGGNDGLVEHWDGRHWAVVDTPRVNLVDGALKAIAGSGPDDAWAVGWRGGPGVTAAVEHWNGHEWSVVSLPPVGDRNTTADAVSTSSPNDVWVVGQRYIPALALHWDGSAWHSVPTPTIRHPWLTGVADLSPTNVWAVGTSYRDPAGRGPAHGLIEHWDGTHWRLVPSPALPPNSSLQSISAAGPNDIWVSGWGTAGGKEVRILLQYDGTHWRNVFIPRFDPASFSFGAVAGPGTTWLAGSELSNLSYEPDRPFVARSCS